MTSPAIAVERAYRWSFHPAPPCDVLRGRNTEQDSVGGAVSQQSRFPEDAHWNAERQAVEFRVEIGEYERVVRVPRRVFQRLG
jgi:hypothetical protein